MKKRITSYIIFMITLANCNQLFAMDTKAIPTFTVNRVIEIEPHDYALDPKKPTIKNISFMGENKEKLLIYEATQIKRNEELSIILRSPHKLNYGEWRENRSILFLDVYNHSTSEQMIFKYVPASVESVPHPIIPPIYDRVERSSDGTTTFLKAYPVATEEQSKPPKTTRPHASVDTPEDSDSILGRESDDDFLDQLAAQQKKQKEIASPATTHSFFTPIIVVSAGFIAAMVMLYKSDRLPESFTQFFNTLFKNPLL